MAGAVEEQERRHGDEGNHRQQHFLVVPYGTQSHVNPCRVLAHRLARLDGGGAVLVTVALSLFAHRRMFRCKDEATDGVVSYASYSDGVDDGTRVIRDAEERARRRRASCEGLSAVVARFAARGRPVTCVVGSMVVPYVLDMVREHGVPLAVFWIQPATVLAAFYHYFHGQRELVASHAADPAYEVTLPGILRPFRIRDFPSFLVDTTGAESTTMVIEAMGGLFELIDQGRIAKVLVNTFDELEPAALAAMRQHLDMVAVGPAIVSPSEAGIHMFDHAASDEKRYTEWLGVQPARSVVHVSFGSIATYSKLQIEEIARALRLCRRPFLLVLRKDGSQEDVRRCLEEVEGQGMVVGWCDQPAVLSHPSVGCFVTHCGWNSTLEAMALGVPIVAAPTLVDQPTNAYLVEEEWVAGVRAEQQRVGESLVFPGEELARCVELVMGDGATATKIRKRTELLKAMARDAVAPGGPAERSLRSFVMDTPAVRSAGAEASTEDTTTTEHVEIDALVEVENSVSSMATSITCGKYEEI